MESSTFKLSNYIINKNKLSNGTFSNFYKGFDILNNKYVGVKRIDIKIYNKFKERIKLEIDILKSINHRYIIKLYEITSITSVVARATLKVTVETPERT